MINYNGQLPPDVDFNSIIPQTTNTVDAINKPAFDSRNYLDFTIPEGQKTREITIRLLPINPEKNEFFQIVHLHNISVNKELKPNKSGKKAYMCLGSKNTGVDHETYGSKCPVCEAQQKIWNQWHEETDELKKKELAKEAGALNTREYCIVRCIERGKEQDGPKFWRIPLRQDQTDAYHKITLLGETRAKEGKEAGVDINIYSLYQGRDLIITFTDGNGAPTVVDKGISTPVSKDNEQLVKWYYDEKKWSDVFSTKPYEYLKLAFEGEVPWYDKINKCWVGKTEFDSIKTAQEENVTSAIEQAENMFKNNISLKSIPQFQGTTPQQIIPQPADNTQSVNSVGNFMEDDDGLPF